MLLVILILSSYLLSIFLGRYLDIKLQIHKDPVHYKGHVNYRLWFIPVINIIFPLLMYLEYEISCRMIDIKHNKFINWFFVGTMYQTRDSKRTEKELNEFWKFKDEVKKDLTNPYNKDE